MSCVRCGEANAPCVAALTPNVHKRLCNRCEGAWREHSTRTLVARNNLAKVLSAFQRWCRAGKQAA